MTIGPEQASNPIITAFANSPDRGRGLARDMAVRWALEEAGQNYDVRLVPIERLKDPENIKVQPFGQIPSYRDGDLTLFESGAIVLHIAQQHHGLLPDDGDARARAIVWMFAALTTVQMPIVEREAAMLLEQGKPWYADRAPMLADRVRDRLRALSQRLGSNDWLEGQFTAGDLLMVNVLRRPAGLEIAQEFANLAAYVARGEDRPAFKRAYAAQHKVFEEAAGR